MSKVKILHIITRLDKGGSSENTLLTCIGLDKRKFDVCLLVGQTVDAYQDLMKEASNTGVRFIFIPELVRNIKPSKDFKGFLKIYSIIRKERFDIVHTHSSKAGFIGRIAAKLARTPVILYTPHGHIFYGYFNRFLTKLFRYMEKLTATFTDRIITLTESGKDEQVRFRIAPAHKFSIVHSGVRMEVYEPRITVLGEKKELGIPDSTKVVGTVGRFVPIKGQKYLIRAIPKIINEYPEVVFILIGDGPLKLELQKEARILGVEKEIKFLSWRENLSKILQIMDIFVFPSINEGMGRALVEAMALGKPVVATKAGGIPGVVLDGKTGILTPPENSEMVAEAIIRLLKDDTLAGKMGEEARKWVMPRFGVRAMIDKIEGLYEELTFKQRG